jgi:hypothetical protein
MYLLNSNKLIYELQHDLMSQADKMKYLLVTVGSQSFLLSYLSLSTENADEPILYALFIGFVSIIGIYFCFRANYMGDNQDFITRYICLALPITIKVILLFIGLLILLEFILVMWSEEALEQFLYGDSKYFFLVELMCELVFIWWLRLHVSKVANFSPVEIATSKYQWLYSIFWLGVTGITSLYVYDKSEIYSPSIIDMDKITEQVYVEPVMELLEREKLLSLIKKAKVRTAKFYGEDVSQPLIIACWSEVCYSRYQEHRINYLSNSVAHAGDNYMVLSKDALDVESITHEWSHTFLDSYIDPSVEIPLWFNEGMAVIASEDKDYTKKTWQLILELEGGAPKLSKISGQWSNNALSEDKSELFYRTSHQEVAAWYAKLDKKSFKKFLKELKNGTAFYEAYLLSANGFTINDDGEE